MKFSSVREGFESFSISYDGFFILFGLHKQRAQVKVSL